MPLSDCSNLSFHLDDSSSAVLPMFLPMDALLNPIQSVSTNPSDWSSLLIQLVPSNGSISNLISLYDRFLGPNQSVGLVHQINPIRMILLDQFYPILSLASNWFRSIIHLLTSSVQSHQIGLFGPINPSMNHVGSLCECSPWVIQFGLHQLPIVILSVDLSSPINIAPDVMIPSSESIHLYTYLVDPSKWSIHHLIFHLVNIPFNRWLIRLMIYPIDLSDRSCSPLVVRIDHSNLYGWSSRVPHGTSHGHSSRVLLMFDPINPIDSAHSI